MRECLGASLRLGLTAFGGPVAHIGYFERVYVEQRQWLTRAQFATLVGLCQMVPGPASSQLGFLIGFHRAGWRGALAAWAGFTLPSALLMALFATMLGHSPPSALRDSFVHGFMLVAVVVVAQAVFGMARSLCPDVRTAMIALAAMALVLVIAAPWATLAVVALGAVAGALVCRGAIPALGSAVPVSPRIALMALLAFAVLMVLALGAWGHGALALAAILYRSGALVFGGGHVVLPVLRDVLVPGHWIDDRAFLAGYGAVQAMPGPLFALAAYLGVACAPVGAPWPIVVLWSLISVIAMFLPGLLLATCALPLWQWLGHHARAQAALAGINAAVIGALAAAWCNPVAVTALRAPLDGVIAVIALVLVVRWRVPPVVMVAMTVLTAVATR